MKKQFNAANKVTFSVSAPSALIFALSNGNIASHIVSDCHNGKQASDKASEFYKRVMGYCNQVETCKTVNEFLKIAFEGYRKNGSLYPDAKITHIKDTDKRQQYPALQELNAFRSYLLTLEELRVTKTAKEPTNTNETEKGETEENETQEVIKQAASLSPIDLINGLLVHFHENGKATKALLKFQKDFIA